MTQAALAQAAGISKGYLSQVEAGRRTGTVDTLRALAQALGVTLRTSTAATEPLAPDALAGAHRPCRSRLARGRVAGGRLVEVQEVAAELVAGVVEGLPSAAGRTASRSSGSVVGVGDGRASMPRSRAIVIARRMCSGSETSSTRLRPLRSSSSRALTRLPKVEREAVSTWMADSARRGAARSCARLRPRSACRRARRRR